MNSLNNSPLESRSTCMKLAAETFLYWTNEKSDVGNVFAIAMDSFRRFNARLGSPIEAYARPIAWYELAFSPGNLPLNLVRSNSDTALVNHSSDSVRLPIFSSVTATL